MADRAGGKPGESMGKTVAEKDRRDLVRKWENTPSPNPEFKGVTPKQVVQKLLRKRA